MRVPQSLVAALERVTATGRTFAALRVECPVSEGAALSLFECERLPRRFYWDQPSAGRAVCGVGALRTVEVEGAGRFASAVQASRELLGEVAVAGVEAPTWAGPLLVGGFGFRSDGEASDGEWRDYAPLSFVLPELLYVRDGERAWLTAVAVCQGSARHTADTADTVGTPTAVKGLIDRIERACERLEAPDVDCVFQRPPSVATEYCARPDRPHAEWLSRVAAATGDMQRGELEKVVLARSLVVETDVPYDIASVLGSLRTTQPTCTTFAVTRGQSVFLGASPERLVRLDGDRLSTTALAGSAPRGRSPAEDERLARDLRESKKEQEEHAFVVREIAAALAPLCERIDYGEAPDVLALEGIQHLETRFAARLRRDLVARPHLLEVAARLHPTPAVCGTPRERAASWLREHEALERGWYAGGVGFVDPDGGGELGVALRSGLLRRCQARLYAGAGLVVASNPEAELSETRLKLRTLLSQLTEI